MIKTNSILLGYRFQGNGNSWIGSNNLTVNGAIQSTGPFGACYLFDGSDDYLYSASNILFGLNYTITCWMKFDNNSNIKYFLSNNTTYGLRYNNTNFLVYAGASGYITVNWTNNNSFNHFAFVRTGLQDYDIYVNGVKIGTMDSNSNNNINIRNIGRRGDANYYFGGKIAELYVFNKPLQSESIRRVMMGFHPLCC